MNIRRRDTVVFDLVMVWILFTIMSMMASLAMGASYLWMQPGAESEKAIRNAEEAGLVVIAGGPCLLVELGYREDLPDNGGG